MALRSMSVRRSPLSFCSLLGMIPPMRGGLKRYFLTGVFVLLPLAASAVVVVWLFHLLDNWAVPFTQQLFGRHIPGVGFLITICIIVLTGMLSSNVIGRW